MMEDIIIRDATAEDIPLVAKCTMAAIGLYDFSPHMSQEQQRSYDFLTEICGADNTLYSYRKARVATISGTPVGCLISYGGESYADARELTFGMAEKVLGIDLSDTETETCDGEYYLDTMAIIPAFRGYGIGKKLLLDGIERGRRGGYGKVTLIVDKEYAHLKEYYASVGFKGDMEMRCFGDTYIKMEI
ncbi:MAG: GNAT family N-acetyltransferase [Bacteroidales bacterium]|nr:GNAT family N-acetyltransferase [Bacteroidales bacterium]